MTQEPDSRPTAREIKVELMSGRTCPLCSYDLSVDRMYRIRGMPKETGAANHAGYHALAGETRDETYATD